ncbi:glutamate-5-semialdehyde dehydrogenase [Inediibacterium massiliense]|uniref:glutamate-5-semialdehyde dehydrogenase n=1 Tax=Inediibacterium massiliense TaxID=1658111 RepID=UPI0006B52263|nr:glutamate-5-semialdehyde dehydrogenase [Inediibacterium massiliense]
MSFLEKCKILKKESENLGIVDTKVKNEALKEVAKSLKEYQDYILKENAKDVENAVKKNTKESLIDRLRLNEDRIDGMIEGIHQIIELKDPVWRSNEVWTLENGLTISKMSVPLGVIGIIYESRPNVTVDAFSLALKSGNCILLRGSSTSLHSNKALVYAIQEGLKKSKISPNAVALVDDPDRALVKKMLTLNEYIDLIIPRGGKSLIDMVVKNATVPTIETGVGNCHIFVDESANLEKALDIIENAKVQRPGVCNACESILIHQNIAQTFLPKLYDRLHERVELRGCENTQRIISVKAASDEDWAEEYLDYILAVKVVEDINEAIDHIRKYGTKHSESILTEKLKNANDFLRKVDAAAVYVNASTRFTDGGEFGFGAEMGISTQKMHARGPMGLNELVTVKYTILGNGQIRG